MVSRTVIVQNPSGFHVRPAGRLSKAAEQCDSKVEILKDNSIINCKSLLNILSGGIQCGEEIEVRCTGENEEKDLEYILDVIKNHLE